MKTDRPETAEGYLTLRTSVRMKAGDILPMVVCPVCVHWAGHISLERERVVMVVFTVRNSPCD